MNRMKLQRSGTIISVDVTDKLCARCSSLNLSAETFLIQDDRPSDSRPSVRSMQLFNERYLLGTFDGIRETASTCQLCGVVWHTLANPPKTNFDAQCYLIWEIDGRNTLFPTPNNREDNQVKRTRRLRVHWSHPALEQGGLYIVLAAPSHYDRSDLDYRGLLNTETEFLGRRVGRTESKRNLIREFLRLCEGHHGERCAQKLGIEGEFLKTLMEPYFGVIDIENDSLVPLPYTENHNKLTFEPYATVSYVWGNDDGHRHHMTTTRNIQSRRKSGGLALVVPGLPQTLREAIRLVHALGIRYIWIDALCIVQDSSHSWNLNARAMHLVYGNAVFTLCAADGPDAWTGLRAMNENHQPQHVADCGNGVHLLLHQSPEASIKASQWNKRAWTFQERLLSRRCLIFTGGRIYFQCRSTVMSEDIFADCNGRGWSLDLLQSPLQMLSQLKIRALWFYLHCVRLYTRRELHEPFDILSAFSGMCKLMEYTLQSPFVFGHPSSHFDLALLWQPTGPATRLKHPKHKDEPKYKDMKFPSWSWCGWKSEGVEYTADMIDGCVTDVRSWLEEHTWIDWHIRDGYGTLRRVWDMSWAKEDRSSNCIWKGYKTTNTSDPGHTNEVVNNSRSTSSSSTSALLRPPEIIIRSRRVERSASPDFGRQSGPTRTVTAREQDNTLKKDDSYQAMSRPEWVSEDRGRKATRRGNVKSARIVQPLPPLRARDLRNASMFASTPPLEARDSYGRKCRNASMFASRYVPKIEFTLTLPEDPYNVRRVTEGSGNTIDSEFPDQPFLQFFTWKASFHVVPVTEKTQAHYASDRDGQRLGPGLRRCHIMDQRGDKCGSIVVDGEWLLSKQPSSHHEAAEATLINGDVATGHDTGDNAEGLDGSQDEGTDTTEFEFIALSEAKDFTKDEFPDWTYYIPRERVESEWDLFFVLLVEHDPVGGFYQRVALGKVFKAAFSLDMKAWSEIILG
ncbi:HET-domain-containing protein [Parathielavia hyrcaniae]|uniref:HET-domain-containing protein n=1 Tax=Parathielavia hyrcaniae TaxID=113614 RepID=A0AAN6Q899_9PEZI|nr:HET-domain-containing protein [Parathielavia hyrcaniae]